jgi:hypothetical protein
MNKELLTFCIVATAGDLERARPLCLEWVKRWKPDSRQTVEEMLPTALSPTGVGPASHYLCAMPGTREEWDDMQAFIVSKDVPVEAALAGTQENNSRSTRANRDKWLPTRGLKMVS